MTPLIEGVLAGYGIAIPVGAIAVLIVATSMRSGLRTGFMAGAGAATADFVYALLATVAGAAIARALAPVELPLRVLGGFLLLFLAIRGLRQGWRERSIEEHEVAPARRRHTYLQFLGLTIINPLTIIYFSALILGRGTAGSQYTTAGLLLFVAGAALASLSWQSLLAILGAAAHAAFKQLPKRRGRVWERGRARSRPPHPHPRRPRGHPVIEAVRDGRLPYLRLRPSRIPLREVS